MLHILAEQHEYRPIGALAALMVCTHYKYDIIKSHLDLSKHGCTNERTERRTNMKSKIIIQIMHFFSKSYITVSGYENNLNCVIATPTKYIEEHKYQD